MSRARDNANLGAQAGSGLDASDITTGVLPVGVTGGSGLTALGTVTAGTYNATIGSSATFPTYHIIHYDIKYDAGAQSTTSNSFVEVDSNLRITHTGAHTDNIFLFEFSTAGMSCDANQMFTSVANVNAITTMLTAYNSCDYNDTTKVPGLMRSYISASTSAITYTPVFRNQNGSSTVHIGGMGTVSNYTFSLTELRIT